MRVRRAQPSDLDRVVGLFGAYREFYRAARSPARELEFLRARLERGEAVVFLAEDDADVLGFTLLYPSFSSISLRPTWILNDLFVRPDSRRRGTGARLLGAARDFARSSGAEYLTLETARNNPAQRLYEAEGWRRDEEFHHYELRV